MAVSQVGSTTTSYYVTNGTNGASTSSKTVTSSSTTVSSATTRSGSASTTSSAKAVSSTTMRSGSSSATSSATVVSSTTSYASATAKTTCSTTVTYSGSSSTAKVSSTTVVKVEAASTNKTGASASTTSSTTASTTISASMTSSSTSVTISDEENTTKFVKGLVDYLKGMLDYYSDFKDGVLDLSKDILSAVADFIAEAEEWVNERNSIDESDAFANMDYDDILTYRVNNAVNPLCVEAFRKCIDEISIGDMYYDDTAYYNHSFNLIFLSKEKDIVNDRGAATTLLHEIGHCIDDVLDFNDDVSNDSDYDFIDVLRNDYNNFVSDVQEKYGLTKEEAYVWIDDWLDEDSDMKHGVSDLITGLSNWKIVGSWKHDEDYYTNSKIENEAFAHFFEAGMSYKPIKLQYIKEVFPNAYKKFEEMLRERL